VQGSAATIARTQAYALRQIDALAEKLEREKRVGDLADLSKEAQATVVDWLAVLARCFQLQDSMSVLELDRVLDSSPDELDSHRLALHVARQRRLDAISDATRQFVARMDAAAGRANTKVLTNPGAARVVVKARNEVSSDVSGLLLTLGVADEREVLEARRWSAAAADVRDGVVGASLDGLNAVGRVGGSALENARSSTGRFAERVAHKLQRTSPEPDGSVEDRWSEQGRHDVLESD